MKNMFWKAYEYVFAMIVLAAHHIYNWWYEKIRTPIFTFYIIRKSNASVYWKRFKRSMLVARDWCLVLAWHIPFTYGYLNKKFQNWRNEVRRRYRATKYYRELTSYTRQRFRMREVNSHIKELGIKRRAAAKATVTYVPDIQLPPVPLGIALLQERTEQLRLGAELHDQRVAQEVKAA